jgi:hypothetical protein
MPLSPANQAVMQTAMPARLRAEFTLLQPNWAAQRWLPQRNRYADDCVNLIKKDTAPGKTITHRHMRQYIAASSFPHCMDGWGYLGRAVEAHLRGDHGVARHLGYYAELRAAMAVLATEAVGVFSNIHLVVSADGKCKKIAHTRTHDFVWDALEYWATTPSAADFVFKIVKPGGLPLGEWLTQFASGGGFRAILAEKWLRQWGLDLMRLRDDRDARNLASYRPTAFSFPRIMPVGEALRFAQEFWSMCEPSEALAFPVIDRYLLRESLELAFRSAHAHKRSRKQAKKAFEAQVARMLHFLTPGDLSLDRWSKFLTHAEAPGPSLVLEEAGGTDQPSHPDHPRQVIGRATLLLRIASGACLANLEALPGGTANAGPAFWWKQVGEDRCLWHPGDPPARFVDLWADISDALQDLHLWRNHAPAGGLSYNSLWRERPASASVLGSCERIGLWGASL